MILPHLLNSNCHGDSDLAPSALYIIEWYREKWERGEVLENNGKKLYWNWEHRMRTSCTARRPDLTLEDTEKKMILLVDMACPNEKNEKREEKMRKYQQLCFELREHREGYTVNFVPVIIGCLGVLDYFIVSRDSFTAPRIEPVAQSQFS